MWTGCSQKCERPSTDGPIKLLQGRVFISIYPNQEKCFWHHPVAISTRRLFGLAPSLWRSVPGSRCYLTAGSEPCVGVGLVVKTKLATGSAVMQQYQRGRAMWERAGRWCFHGPWAGRAAHDIRIDWARPRFCTPSFQVLRSKCQTEPYEFKAVVVVLMLFARRCVRLVLCVLDRWSHKSHPLFELFEKFGIKGVDVHSTDCVFFPVISSLRPWQCETPLSECMWGCVHSRLALSRRSKERGPGCCWVSHAV